MIVPDSGSDLKEEVLLDTLRQLHEDNSVAVIVRSSWDSIPRNEIIYALAAHLFGNV